MSWVAAAVIGGSVIGGIITGEAQKSAASEAAGAQTAAQSEAIAEQRRQFDEIRNLLDPFVSAGETALTAQQSLIGLGGDEAQREAIQRLEESPQFQALTEAGEEAILAGASATGGLRGGDVQAALAQFRPSVLSNLIESQFGRLGGIAGRGQTAAAGVGAAGQQTGTAVSGLIQQRGAVQAGEALARGEAAALPFQELSKSLGLSAGLELGPFSRQPGKF